MRYIVRAGTFGLIAIVLILVVPSPAEGHIVSTIIYGLFALTFIIAVLQGTLSLYVGAYAIRANWQMRRLWQRNPDKFTLHDISAENPEVEHPIALEFISELEQLGFQPLGTARSNLFTEYILTNEDAAVSVVVRPRSTQLVQLFFGSQFDDTFFLETGYHGSLHLNLPLLQLHSLTESIAAAYDYHLGEMNRLIVTGRQPVPLETMQQYLERAQLYYSRYLLLENTTMVRGLSKQVAVGCITAFLGIAGLMQIDQMANGLVLMVPTIALLGLNKLKIPELEAVEPRKRKAKTADMDL